MKLHKRLTAFFWIAVIMFLLMAGCFLLMPFAVTAVSHRTVFVKVLGASFWLTAICGYLAVILGGMTQKTLCQRERIKVKGRPGIVSFLSNPPALFFDAALLVSVAIFAVVMLTDLKASYFAYVSIFLLVLSLHMHAMFNGKMFKTIIKKYKQKRSGKNHGRYEKQ